MKFFDKVTSLPEEACDISKASLEKRLREERKKHMNKHRESQIAWEAAVKAAKAGNRALNIWPGDEERVRIEDLPKLREVKGCSEWCGVWKVIPVDSDKMLQRVVKVGKSYGLGVDIPDPDGYFMVVEIDKAKGS